MVTVNAQMFQNPASSRADTDKQNPTVEQGVLLPVAADPAGSYVYYECSVASMLDSGIAVHNRLPQVNNAFDTLALHNLDDPALETFTDGGVNLECNDQYQDIVQRMGHARYWFRLWGQALRVGFQVPIPSLKTIGGVPAIPYDRNPQWGYNTIAPGGNYSGVILWLAQWSLWYTTAVPPSDSDDIAIANPMSHINGDATLPNGIQSPYSQVDDNAVTSGFKG